MNILVLGAEGMLGHKMFQSLSLRFPKTQCTILGSLGDPFYRSIPLFAPDRTIEHVDAMDLPGLKRVLEAHHPDVIVNCIGIIKQRDEARNAIPSITINSLLPHLLSQWGPSLVRTPDSLFHRLRLLWQKRQLHRR